MKHRDLLSREWCDIVFEHRNKEYGAYLLRSQTGRRYGLAVCVLFFLILLAVLPIIIYFFMHRPQKINFDGDIKKIVRFDGVRIKEARAVKSVVRQEELADPLAEKQMLSLPKPPAHKEKGEEEASEDLAMLLEKVQENLRDSIKAQEDALLPTAKSLQQTTGVVLDTIPHHPEGLAGFMKWLTQTMVYPPGCLRRKEAGPVVVAFIVEPTGEISNIRILQGDSRDLNNEVLRVLYLMPKWIPARRHGHPVRAQVTLPVEFQLSEEPYS